MNTSMNLNYRKELPYNNCFIKLPKELFERDYLKENPNLLKQFVIDILFDGLRNLIDVDIEKDLYVNNQVNRYHINHYKTHSFNLRISKDLCIRINEYLDETKYIGSRSDFLGEIIENYLNE